MAIELPYEATKEYLYMQYRNNAILQDLKEVEREYIQENIYDVLNEWINAIDYQNTDSTYIFFWALKYLGLKGMFGASQASTLYDTGINYDEGEIYDNYNEINAFVSVNEMRVYTSFLMDYSQRCLSLPLIIKFCAGYTMCDMGDFTIETTLGHITITIPNKNERCLSLYSVLTAQNLAGMPYGANPIIWKYKEE